MDELVQVLEEIRKSKEYLLAQSYNINARITSMEADLKSLEWRVTMLMAGELYFEDGIDEQYMERELDKVKKGITLLEEEMKW